MERAASPRLRNTSFVPTRRFSTGMTSYHSLSSSNHSQTKRRLEFDDDVDDAPHPLPSSLVLVPPARANRLSLGTSTAFNSSVIHQQSSSSAAATTTTAWNHRHLDNQVLESNRSDHARHSRLLDFSNHSSQQPVLPSPGRSGLAPPGRRVDSGDDERLEAPTRFWGGGCTGGASLCGGGSTGYGASDDKSLATMTSLRSRSVMSRQHSLLSLDNLSFSTELHVLMQRQTSQSSLCSFASHAIHKRRNSWGSTCGASAAGDANIPPFLLRLTSASSALEAKGGSVSGASIAEKLTHSHDDDSTESWLRHVTSIRHDTTVMSHVRRERLASHLQQQQHRPANPITADAFWLQQMSSRSLSSFTTITTTTTTRTTTNNVTPPLPSTLSLNTSTRKGTPKTPHPSPEDAVVKPVDGDFRGTRHGMWAGLQDPQQRPIQSTSMTAGLDAVRPSALRYSPEQPPYYQRRRTESSTKSSVRSLRFSDDASAIMEGASTSASASSQPMNTLTSQSQQYQPPLPLHPGSQTDGSDAMDLDDHGQPYTGTSER